MDKSTHRVEVVEVRLEKHPNADTLSIVNVFGGYPCAVRTADWHDGQLAAYIPPDSVVDVTRPEFAFLGEGHSRIRAKRLRGIMSMGLLVLAPPGSKVGDDVAEALGVSHYEPPLDMVMDSDNGSAPGGYRPVYDVDSLRRYPGAFVDGELVHVTEKVHGANSRFCCHDGDMYAGSHRNWKKYDTRNLWWQALAQHPEVTEFCRDNPMITVYAEVYGQVQDLKYGVERGAHIAVFDLLRDNGQWIDAREASEYGWRLPWVPLVAVRGYDFYPICALADGPSLIPGANNMREGIVVKPVVERQCLEVGRLNLKVVSADYLARKG